MIALSFALARDSVRRVFPSGGAFLLFIASSFSAAAQTGSLSGRVTEKSSGQAVSNAHVEAFNTTIGGIVSTLTRDDGRFVLPGLQPGVYSVQVRSRIGLATRILRDVVVSANSSTTIDVAVEPVPAQLDEVVTTGTRGAESEKILDSPNSIFVVSESRIAERPVATITDHIKSVPGLSISTGGILQANIVSRGFNNAFSGSMLMLQDYRFAGVPSLRVNIPALFTGTNEDIERIEVLQGPAAALYGPNSGSRCAARHHEVAVHVAGHDAHACRR